MSEKYGFDAVFISERHPLASPNEYGFPPIPALAGIISATNKVLVGTNILVLPFYQPVLLAENLAMLDVMSKGRMILGAAIGYREEELRAYAVPKKERAPRFEEIMEILKGLWTQTPFNFKGKFYELSNIYLNLKPIQKPRPPIWIGAELEPAIRRAALMGDAVLIADTCSIPLLKRKYLRIYYDTLDSIGRDTSKIERPLMRESFVANDRNAAYRIGGTSILQNYRDHWKWGAPQLREEFPNNTFTLADLIPDRLVIGTPQDCIEQIEKHIKELSLTFFLFRLQRPGMKHEDVLSAIKLLGEKVLPYFKDRN